MYDYLRDFLHVLFFNDRHNYAYMFYFLTIDIIMLIYCVCGILKLLEYY